MKCKYCGELLKMGKTTKVFCNSRCRMKFHLSQSKESGFVRLKRKGGNSC